jgi:hypothetical protein
MTVQYLLKLLSKTEANGPSLTLTTGRPLADPQSSFFDVDMMSVPFTAKLFLGYVSHPPAEGSFIGLSLGAKPNEPSFCRWMG